MLVYDKYGEAGTTLDEVHSAIDVVDDIDEVEGAASVVQHLVVVISAHDAIVNGMNLLAEGRAARLSMLVPWNQSLIESVLREVYGSSSVILKGINVSFHHIRVDLVASDALERLNNTIDTFDLMVAVNGSFTAQVGDLLASLRTELTASTTRAVEGERAVVRLEDELARVMRRYRALAESRLGRATLAYWRMRRRRR